MAPFIPIAKEIKEGHDLTKHEEHTNCEAMAPIGYIWLDQVWREQRADLCFMSFMALTGEKDLGKPGRWTITMLMLLHQTEAQEDSYNLNHERVQVMDCLLEEERWAMVGAKTILINLI